MTTPLDRLADDFPHGTIEGEQRGCIGQDCPSTPFRCIDVRGKRRSDMRFKRLYDAGLRGVDLLDVLEGRQPQPDLGGPLEPGRSPFRGSNSATLDDGWAELDQAGRDSWITTWVDNGWTWQKIADRIGTTPSAASRMHAAAQRRMNAVAYIVEPQEGIEDERPEEALVEEALADPAPQSFYPALRTYPWSVVQLWVVLDDTQSIVMASTAKHIAEAFISDDEDDQ